MPMVAYMSFTAYAMTVYHKCIRTSIYAAFQGWRGGGAIRQTSSKSITVYRQKFTVKIVTVKIVTVKIVTVKIVKVYGEKVRFKNSSVDRKKYGITTAKLPTQF